MYAIYLFLEILILFVHYFPVVLNIFMMVILDFYVR